MGLITKEVEVTVNSANIKHFEELGYDIPKIFDRHKNKYIFKRGQTLFVKVEDLKYGSHAIVECNCDLCNKPLNIEWRTYKKTNHEGKIYCRSCANRIFNSGDKSSRWKDSKTNEEREKGRAYPEYGEFVQRVLARDNYTCIITKKSRDEAELEVHHLNGYDWDIQGRTDVKNGITITKELHKAFHMKYGYGNNTREQFLEFVGNIDLILEDYDGDIPTTRWAYCITDGEIIKNIKQYAKMHNYCDCNIYDCCNGKKYTCHKKIYIWYDDYKQMSEDEIKEYINKCKNGTLFKSVICTTTNLIFDCATYAGRFYKISNSGITACCKFKQKHAGKLSDGTKLQWLYLSEYLEQHKNEIENIDEFIEQHTVK